MTQKIAAFDFATSGNFAGICAACIYFPEVPGEVWPKDWPRNKDRKMHPEKLHPVELMRVTKTLIDLQEEGYMIVGWGSLGYDFRLLYDEGVMQNEVVDLALSHYDIMFQIFARTNAMASLHSVKNIGPEYDKNIAKNTPKLWRESEDSQAIAMRNMMTMTEKIYNIADRLLNENRRIEWYDYTGNIIRFGDYLQPCSNFVLPALQLPAAILMDKWAKTFSWLRENVTSREQGRKTDHFLETLQMTNLVEVGEVPF